MNVLWDLFPIIAGVRSYGVVIWALTRSGFYTAMAYIPLVIIIILMAVFLFLIAVFLFLAAPPG